MREARRDPSPLPFGGYGGWRPTGSMPARTALADCQLPRRGSLSPPLQPRGRLALERPFGASGARRAPAPEGRRRTRCPGSTARSTGRACSSSTAGSTPARSDPGPVAIGPVEGDARRPCSGPAGRPRGLDASARPRPCAGRARPDRPCLDRRRRPSARRRSSSTRTPRPRSSRPSSATGWINRLTRIEPGQGRPADARPPDPLRQRLRQPDRPRRARRRREPDADHARRPAAATPGSTARSACTARRAFAEAGGALLGARPPAP